MLFKIIRNLIWGSLFFTAISGAGAAGLYYESLGSMPNVSDLKRVTFETPMKIYTSDRKLIGEFGESKRIPVSLNQIPEKLRQAFIAIEDNRFYDHSGIDPIGILRAVSVAVSNAEATQGASTITQQLARNFFLTRERTLKRKLNEIFISLRIEQVLTKDEIFELYLNKIALGHRAYGVAAAAQTYYGKDLTQLNLAEMATIAGLPKAPSLLNPISHPERSRERRHVVLSRMLDLGYITEQEFKEADRAPYKAEFHSAPLEAYAPYVAEKARQFALDKFGEQAYTGGFEIYTTVRSDLAEAAHYAVFKGVSDYDTRHGYRGAVTNTSQLDNFNNSDDEIAALLKKYDNYHYLTPMLVQEVDDHNKTARLIDRRHRRHTLPWDGMNWAAEFKSDRNQGPLPKKPSEFLRKGDVIFTALDEKGALRLSQLPEVEASIVALSPTDGSVVAMVGGYDFAKSKFDRTYQSRRQTGSNFKPFLYSAAVAKGITINSLFQDQPIRTWDAGSRTWWSPKNSPNRYDGIMTLREALARSKNVVSIRLIRQVGVPSVVEHVTKFGFNVPRSQQVEAMALGSVEVTPMELVRGYATFANGGFRLEPFLITRITREGQTVYDYTPQPAIPAAPDRVVNAIPLIYKEGMGPEPGVAPQVITHDNAYIVADMMGSVIYGGRGVNGSYWGTGGRAKTVTGREDLHGKTGTTNNVHDAWFSGFNANVVATAWMGFDTDRDLGYSRSKGPEGGAYSALPIWAEFIKRAQNGVPEAPLLKPEDLGTCSNSGIVDLCIKGTKAIADHSYEADPFDGEDFGDAPSSGSRGVDTSSVDSDDIF
ncbi:MAG: PBP1A family penicillin-binding protein [Succinivibrio sp.]|nr:PBP1A family penicillin-binding protein [Succinivibrio sp.]